MARAKVQLGQSMRFVGQQAVQLHGGIGVTDEYIVSHYFKKLTQLEVALATRCTTWARFLRGCRIRRACLPERGIRANGHGSSTHRPIPGW